MINTAAIEINRRKLADVFRIKFYIIREILVNFIGYKLGVRALLRRGKVANVSGKVNVDIQDKGVKHFQLINDILTQYGTNITRERMVEIGPGGTLLHGLLEVSMENSWTEYIGVDVFPSDVWSEYPLKLYKAALNSIDKIDKKKAVQALTTSQGTINGSIKYFGKNGVDGEEFRSCVGDASVDLIYSWGVFEHIVCPLDIFRNNFKILKDNGIIIHIIDTHPHTWSRFKSNPYSFLCISDWLWDLMYSKRGFMNRHRASSYVQWAQQAGFKTNIYKKEINMHAPLPNQKDLLKRFQNADKEDLLTDRIYLVLTK